MRYTEYNSDLGRYEVPCYHKVNGEDIRFFVRTGPGEVYHNHMGAAVYQARGLTYVSGEVIDRLAELENAAEQKSQGHLYVKKYGNYYRCSACHNKAERWMHFCPNCGVKIEGVLHERL